MTDGQRAVRGGPFTGRDVDRLNTSSQLDTLDTRDRHRWKQRYVSLPLVS